MNSYLELFPYVFLQTIQLSRMIILVAYIDQIISKAETQFYEDTNKFQQEKRAI